MDVVDKCKDKLEHFRIKELKDVLTRTGLSKQGRKQDLMDRVLALLYDEGTPGLFKHINGKEDLVAIIDDAYRKMQEEGVIDSNAKKQSSSSSHGNQLHEEAGPLKLRCVCDSSAVIDVPIQCADPSCNIWQHVGCALMTEQDILKHPLETQFFCQTCRVERADPFWETIAHLLYPVKLVVSSIPVDSSKPFQHIEKTFELSKANKDLVVKAEYDVQAWCMLLTDSVPYRVQWPLYAELLVNGVPFRTYNRPGSQPLGANGRDDGVKIALFLVDGVNKISLSGCDGRDFCLGVRLVKRQTFQQVLSIIPQESVGESFEDALARVKRCTGGGFVAKNDDSDSDLEVVTDSITVSLRCPMSGCRMKTAGRFKPCVHMGCFDLETFIQMNERSRKWQCPICLKNYSLENIIIDPYFNRIVNVMRQCGEEISEVELKPDGSWRVKDADVKDLSQWHFPDGSLSIVSGSSESIIQQNFSHYDPTLGQQKNTVARAVGGPEGISKLNLLDTEVQTIEQQVITMSSSSSEDQRENGIPSFNQDSGEQVVNLSHNEDEVNSVSSKKAMPHGIENHHSSAQVVNTELIILSDSEEDEVSLFQLDSPSAVLEYEDNRLLPTALPECTDQHPAFSSIGMCSSSNRTDDYVRTPQLPFSSISEDGSRFHSIDAATVHLDAVIGYHTADTFPDLVNDNELLTVISEHNGNQVVDSSVLANNVTANSGVTQDFVIAVDNNLCEQNFLAAAPVSGNISPVLNAIPAGEVSFSEASCRHGSCSNIEACVEPTGTSQPDSVIYSRSKRRFSLPVNTNGGSCTDPGLSRKRTGDPFSFPRRKRSGRVHQN